MWCDSGKPFTTELQVSGFWTNKIATNSTADRCIAFQGKEITGLVHTPCDKKHNVLCKKEPVCPKSSLDCVKNVKTIYFSIKYTFFKFFFKLQPQLFNSTTGGLKSIK